MTPKPILTLSDFSKLIASFTKNRYAHAPFRNGKKPVSGKMLWVGGKPQLNPKESSSPWNSIDAVSSPSM